MQNWFIALAFVFSGAASAVSNDDSLSGKQMVRIQADVDEYFTPGSPNSGNIRRLEEFRPYLPTLELLLKELRKRVDLPDFNASDYGRATRYLRMLAEMAVKLGPVMPHNELRTSVQRELRELLEHYQRPSEAREQIMKIFDALSLWGAEDAIVFLRINEIPDIVRNVTRLRSMMPLMNPDQLDVLAANLRGLDKRGDSSLMVALLMETGRAKEKDLTRLLVSASAEFARSLIRSEPDQDDDFQIMRLESVTSRLVSNKLDQVMWALRDGDPAVGSAFTSAVEQVRTSRLRRDHLLRDRNLFFTLLQEGRLDWSDRASWRARAAAIEREGIPIRSRYRVEENVILVNFGPKKPNCEDELE